MTELRASGPALQGRALGASAPCMKCSQSPAAQAPPSCTARTRLLACYYLRLYRIVHSPLSSMCPSTTYLLIPVLFAPTTPCATKMTLSMHLLHHRRHDISFSDFRSVWTALPCVLVHRRITSWRWGDGRLP